MSAGPLAPSELQAAETAIVGFVQRKHFKEELIALESKGAVVKKSSIYLLEQFLDEEGILRVAGSLRNAPPPEKVGTQLSCLRFTMCRNLLYGELVNFRVDTLEKSTYLHSLGRKFGS